MARVTPRAGPTTGSKTSRPPLALLADHTDRLFRAAYALCGTRAEAEDLVQETLACVLERPRLARRRSKLAYLMRILREAWLERERTSSARPGVTGSTDEVEWVADRGGDPSEARLAYDALRRLSPQLREAVVAVDVVGLSQRQAARALRVRRSTLTSRLCRGRERIAAALGGSP